MDEDIDLAFLSEPQLFQHDLSELPYLNKNFCFQLNSDDLHDPELPFNRSKPKGGTMKGGRTNIMFTLRGMDNTFIFFRGTDNLSIYYRLRRTTLVYTKRGGRTT